MMRLVSCVLLVLALAACSPKPPPPPPTPLSEVEVQDFVRKYVAAFTAGDATTLMSMISKDPSVTSTTYGRTLRGWDEIRKDVDANIASAAYSTITLATVSVQSLAPDVSIALAPFTLTVPQKRQWVQLQGAATIVLRRSSGTLYLVHEHYSLVTEQ